jgi:cellobiose phosphorylase
MYRATIPGVVAFAGIARLTCVPNPVWGHARRFRTVTLYKVEPYVVATDVYALAPHIGRGGWTWYTGSAGWM